MLNVSTLKVVVLMSDGAKTTLGVMESTRDRFNDMKPHGSVSADEFLSELMDVYEREPAVEINRDNHTGPVKSTPADEAVGYCLNQIESNGFANGVSFSTEIAPHLTVEEVIGALVRAEQEY
jgi:hypothetical protein